MKNFKLLVMGCLVGIITQAQNPVEIHHAYYCEKGSVEQQNFDFQSVKSKQTLMLSDFDSLNMSFVGNWGLGQSFSISCSPTGDTVFVGAGAGVIVFDATDPYNPVKISEIHARALVDGSAYDPVNKMLYLAAYFSGLEIWDVSDFSNPHRLGRIPTSGLSRGGVHYRLNSQGLPEFAYLVTVADGVDVFNVTDPQNPSLAGNYNFTGNQFVWNSFKSGDTLFLSAGAGGARAIDLSASPVLSTLFNITTPTTSIHVEGQNAYIVNSNFGLRVFNFSTLPAVQEGQLQLAGYPYNLIVDGDYAYIANSTTNPGGGINIIDVSNSGSPQYITDYAGFQTYLAGKNNIIYSTGGQEGCLFLDVSVPSSPVAADTYKLPISVSDIAVSGNYAYTGSNGLRVFDVSDKTHPFQVGYNETPGDLVKVSGNIAIFCPESMGSNNNVNVMDISDPENPTFQGHYLAPVMTNDLELKDNYAFVACWWDGFRVINFSDPENPTLAAHKFGWYNGAVAGVEWCYVQALDIEGNYLYLIDYGPFETDDTKGLYIFDITDPGNPVFVSRYADYQGLGYDIKVSGEEAVYADSQGGLGVINVSDPNFPYQESYLSLGDAAWAVDISWPYAFVANYIMEGVQAIDISNPAFPSVAGYYKPSGCFALGVTYNAGYLFVADGPAGFDIYNFDLLSGTKEKSITNENDLQVWPNPTKDRISVSMNLVSSDILTIELCNASGRSIKSLYNGNENAGYFIKSFTVSEMPKGVYLLKIDTGQTNYFKKDNNLLKQFFKIGCG